MKRITLVILLLANFLFSQKESSFDAFVNHLEKEIVSYEVNDVLQQIDSVFSIDVSKLTQKQVLMLQTIKVEALTLANMFDDSIVLSQSLLKNNQLTTRQKIRILINNALAYEYVGNFKVTKQKLDSLSTIYADYSVFRDNFYARYLYRTSSFYRMQKKYDSLAFDFAKKAKAFSEANNYDNENAVSSMLLGFLSSENNSIIAEKHFKDAIQFWKKTDDEHGMSSMYIGLAKFKVRQQELDVALKYTDTSITVLNKSNLYGSLANSYKTKSAVFEKLNQPDSAIFYLKKHQEFTEEETINNQQIKLNQLNYNYRIDKLEIQSAKDLFYEKLQNKNLKIALIILTILLAIIGFLFLRIRNNTKKIKQQQITLQKNITNKQVLLQELHHRVKNNLAMVLSLINLQTNKLKNKEDKEQLKILNERVKTIAITHNQFLYSDDKKQYSLKNYLDKIFNKLVSLHSSNVAIDAKIDDSKISIDTALPIGIIVNELITNSLKYAINEVDLKISLDIEKRDNKIHIRYSDNGKITNKPKRKEGIGLFLIASMVKQLQGTVTNKNFEYHFVLAIKNE